MTSGMAELLRSLIPLLLFILSPALLPLIGWIIGTLHDLVRQQHLAILAGERA